MLILPLAPDLRLGHKPIVTFVIFALCVGIHVLHDRSRGLVQEAAEAYCAGIPEPWLGSASEAVAEHGLDDCVETLVWMHRLDTREDVEGLYQLARAEDALEGTDQALTGELGRLLERYDEFARSAPSSMTAAMIYHPDSPNPLRMLTSSLLHSDWWHLIFNMIFFLAFATALEILVGSTRVFLAIMAIIAVVTGVLYSAYAWLVDSADPTLGFSGIVMGMIGLSAYLMPRARIRTFCWFGIWAWIVFIPAWIYAAWYIGWDLIDFIREGHESGTNLFSHIVGAVTGYLLGRWWLPDRKWLIEVELQEEIEHMRAHQWNWLGIGGFRVDGRTLASMKREQQLEDHLSSFDDTLRRVYKLNETHQHGDAVVMLLNALEQYGESEHELRYAYETVLTWTPSRVVLCMARHYINHLMDQDKRKAALNVCEECFAIAPEFVLSRPLDVMPLARDALKQGRYALARALVHDPEERYGDAIDGVDARLLEARLLAMHLDRPADAYAMLQQLFQSCGSERTPEVAALMTAIEPLLET